MTPFIIYAAAAGLGGLSWVTLAMSDWMLREANEKWPIKLAFPSLRHRTGRARNKPQHKSRSHRQMGYIHEKGRGHFSAH